MSRQGLAPIPFTFAADVTSTMMTEVLGDLFYDRFKYVEHYKLADCPAYVAIVPLITTYALSENVNALVLGGNQHIFNLIHSHIIAAAAQRRCVLLFDASPEGDPFVEDAFSYLHAWMQQHSIPSSQVLVMTQNRAMKAKYDQVFGGGISFLNYDSYIKKILKNLARTGDDFESVFGFDKKRLAFLHDVQNKISFLSLNGTPRSNRIVAAAGMLKKGFLDDAIWSMLGSSSNKMSPSGEGARHFRTVNGLDWIADEDIDRVLAQTPRLIEGEDLARLAKYDANDLAIQLSIDIFERTFASIVTETDFSNGDILRITEKSIKPAAAGHPFVVLGNPYSLTMMREIGFSTFGHFIDESYDDLLDVGPRLNAAFAAVSQLGDVKRRNDPKEIRALGEICARNVSFAKGEACISYEQIYEARLADVLENMLFRDGEQLADVSINRFLVQSHAHIRDLRDGVALLERKINDLGGWQQQSASKIEEKLETVAHSQDAAHAERMAELQSRLRAEFQADLEQQIKSAAKKNEVTQKQSEEKIFRKVEDMGGLFQDSEKRISQLLDELRKQQSMTESKLSKCLEYVESNRVEREADVRLRLSIKNLEDRQSALELNLRRASGEIQRLAETAARARNPLSGAQLLQILKWPFGFAARAEAREHVRKAATVIASSSLYDAAWYRNNYADVVSARTNPAEHYYLFGWREGRDPGPDFSTNWYLSEHADIAAAGINPLLHYETDGRREGRAIRSSAFPAEVRALKESPLFDPHWYLHVYPDISAGESDPASHYCAFGWKEGRDPGPEFSTRWYLSQHRDIEAAGINPLLHYEMSGRREGRSIKSVGFVEEMKIVAASSLFDGRWYRETYSDVAREGTDPVLHYCEFGWREGRDPGPGFSTKLYLRDNVDIAAVQMNPLWHFEAHGRAEGRRGETVAIAQRPDTIEEIRKERSAVPCLAGAEGPVVMIVDDRWPEPDRDSGSIDAVNMIDSFIRLGYHVVAAVESTLEQDPRYLEDLKRMGAHPMTESDAVNIRRFVEQYGHHVDLFVLSRVGAGGQYLELIRYNCPEARIIFNTVDLHYIREARAARLADDQKALLQSEYTRDREELIVGRADLTLVVSSVEKEILSASVVGGNTAVVPLARAIKAPRRPFAERAGIGFVGGFGHKPNIDAIEYFLSEVWPKVHAIDTAIKFEIVGPNFPVELLDGVQGDVKYLGALDSLDGWLENLRMTVAPLRIGAGAKGKVASSLCAGLPCVISAVAAEGMGLDDGVNVMIANDPAEMAEKIARLHEAEETWSRISGGALEFAERNLSVANYRNALKQGLLGINMPVY